MTAEAGGLRHQAEAVVTERGQGLLWAIEVRGGVLVEAALDRAWKDPLDTGEGRR